jgi:hypothetical protein
MATNRKSKKAGIAINFSDTESQTPLPEGDFLFEVDDVEQKTSENSGADYLSVTFKVAEGEFKGKKVWHNCSLQPQALFNLRGVLEALGFEVPQGVMELDPADMIGETCGGTVQLEVYEGKKRPRIVEFFPASELGEEAPEKTEKPVKEPEPEAPPATKTKKKASKKEEPTIEVGSKVSFTDDEGEELEGKVLSIDGDTALVKVGKEEWEISIEELTLA